MISVVVPTHNRKHLLKECIGSITSQEYDDYELVIVDDGSSDGTGEMVRAIMKREKRIRYLRQENTGHSLARNLGFSMARGDIIASTDDDCVVGGNWLETIQEGLDRHPSAVAIGGPVCNPLRTRISCTHHIVDFSSWFPENRRRFMKNMPTCNIAYRRGSIGGISFDDDMRMYGYRDSLFNLEVRKRGKILFEPDMKVYHHRWSQGGSMEELLNIQRRHGMGFYRNGYIVHGKAGLLLRRFPLLGFLPPRIMLVFLRCMKVGRTTQFLGDFPLIVRCEISRRCRNG